MNTGAMIAHFPGEDVKAQLAKLAADHFGDKAERADNLHLTLAFLGEAADLGDDDPMELSNCLASLSQRLAPMKGEINGITRFMDNDPHAIVVNADVPGLNTLRSWLFSEVRGAGIEPVVNHGFTPHLTLAYVSAGQSVPDIQFSPIPFTLDSITLAVGDDRKVFPLSGSVALSEAKRMSALSEAGVYDVSVSELNEYSDGLSESVPKDAPETEFADPPHGLYVGDAKHAALAVQAVTSGLEGNRAKARSNPGVKDKIAAAVRKFYSGAMQKYYLSWLHTGKKPEKRPGSEILHEMYVVAPSYSTSDETRFPQVPIAPGVDIAALTAGDPHPVYVVRPLAILDEVSINGLPYNEAVFNDVYHQVVTKRPVARRGHIPADEKSSAFPPDDGYWVGAVIDSSVYGKPTVFGMCYVVPGETRDMVLRRRAAGTALSNSLWGDIFMSDENGQVTPVGIELESIDFVPEERAALQALGGKYQVISEMNSMEDPMTTSQEAMREAIAALKPSELHEMMSEAQRHHVADSHLKKGACAECTDNSLHEMLSESRRRTIAETQLRENATPEETYKMLDKGTMKTLAEMYAQESNMRLVPREDDEKKDKEAKDMTEMRQALAESNQRTRVLEQRVFDTDLDKALDGYFEAFHVTTDKGVEGLKHLRDQMQFRALAEMAGMKGGQVAENISAGCQAAWPHIKPLAEMFISAAGGPNAFTGNIDNSFGGQQQAQFGYDPKKGQYVTDGAVSARAKAGW